MDMPISRFCDFVDGFDLYVPTISNYVVNM